MNAARWQQVKQVLESALDRPPADRAAFVAQACGDDASLRGDVESLVAAHDNDPSFIEVPAVGEWAAPSRISSPPAAYSSGQSIGPYQVTRLVASGGMGAVYEAVRADDAFRKKVAIKIIRQDVFADPRHRDELLRRFRAERQTLANLEHSNIARLLDGGSTSDGAPYLVMEFVEGRPIDVHCDEHRLPVAERLRLFRSVCSAVLYAHQKLVIHRDLKPANVLVDDAGAAKLLDFGIAKLIDPDSSALVGFVTRTAGVPLTPAYASPEQIRGQPVTTATDVYSLGVILYELLTGHRPYRLNGHGVHDLPRLICEEEPTKPSLAVTQPWSTEDSRLLTPDEISRTREGRPNRLRRRLAGDLDTIVLTALRKEPDRRYASVEQFSDDIRRHLEREPIIARSPTVGYRAAKFVRRHKWGVVAATLVAVSLALGLVGTSVMYLRAEQKARVAGHLASFYKDLYQPPSHEPFDFASVDWSRRGPRKDVTLDMMVSAGIDRIPRIDDDPLTEADLRANMGRICDELHRFDDARTLHREALAIRRRDLGIDDPRTIESLANLGFALMMSGEWPEAEPVLAEAAGAGARVWGPSDRDTLGAQMNLAYVQSRLGRKDQAEAALRKVLPAYREQFGEQGESTLRAMNMLGKLLGERKQFAEADALLARTVEISRTLDARGPDHPATLEAVNNLAGLRYQQDRVSEAVELFRELHGACRRVLTPEDVLTLKVGNNLARCLTRLDQLEDARAILEVVVAQADEILPTDDFNAALFHGNYGECLARLGKCHDAEPHLTASYKAIKKRVGAAHDATRKAIQRLAEFHEKCGPVEKARAFRDLLAASSNSESQK